MDIGNSPISLGITTLVQIKSNSNAMAKIVSDSGDQFDRAPTSGQIGDSLVNESFEANIERIMGGLKTGDFDIMRQLETDIARLDQDAKDAVVKRVSQFLAQPDLERVPELVNVSRAVRRVLPEKARTALIPNQIALLRFGLESIPTELRGIPFEEWPEDAPISQERGRSLNKLAEIAMVGIENEDPSFDDLLSPSTTDNLEWLLQKDSHFPRPEKIIDLLCQSPEADRYLDVAIKDLLRPPHNEERFQKRLSGMSQSIVPKLFAELRAIRAADEVNSPNDLRLAENIVEHIGSRLRDFDQVVLTELELEDPYAKFHALDILSYGGSRLNQEQADKARQLILDQMEENKLEGLDAAVIGALSQLARVPTDLAEVREYIGRDPEEVSLELQQWAADSVAEALHRIG